jgi:hypothetical protein
MFEDFDINDKPEGLTEAHLLFLDSLRESGETNMWGAAEYLSPAFSDISYEQAGPILLYWMGSFGARHNK